MAKSTISSVGTRYASVCLFDTFTHVRTHAFSPPRIQLMHPNAATHAPAHAVTCCQGTYIGGENMVYTPALHQAIERERGSNFTLADGTVLRKWMNGNERIHTPDMYWSGKQCCTLLSRKQRKQTRHTQHVDTKSCKCAHTSPLLCCLNLIFVDVF